MAPVVWDMNDQGVSDQIVPVVGTLLGVALGLFGERWVRTWGEVRCDVRWRVMRSAGSLDGPGGVEVQERYLEVTFLNRKEVPVTVWEMQVVFYRGDKPLNAEEKPHLELSREHGGRGPLELLNLSPRIPVTRTVYVFPGHNESVRQRAVEEADRVEFVAIVEGAKDIRKQLALWNDLAPQTRKSS